MAGKKESSQITSQLNCRIGTNRKFGAADLDGWLLKKIGLKAGSSVLDVGCGTGNHLIDMAEIYPHGNYYGIDISKNSIEEAKTKAIKKNLNIKFICGDASDASSLQDGFFDVVMSVYSLYYVKNAGNLLDVLKKKLAAGGKIAVMCPYRGNNEEWYSFLSSFMKIPEEIRQIADNFMDKEVLPFAKSNFSSLKTHNFTNTIVIPSYGDLKNYWLSNIYHKEEFDNAFEKKAGEFFGKNNKFTITKRALLAIMS